MYLDELLSDIEYEEYVEIESLPFSWGIFTGTLLDLPGNCRTMQLPGFTSFPGLFFHRQEFGHSNHQIAASKHCLQERYNQNLECRS